MTKNELLRELVIAIGCLVMLLSGVSALYWMQRRPDDATAGTPGEVTTPDGAAVHADIYFDFKSTRLRADAAKLLQDTAAAMGRAQTWAVLLTGYSDSQGPAAYNRVLAQRRTETVKQFLVELGVPESSIKVVAVGPEATLCDEPSKECQQLNRRVHLELRRLATVASASPAMLTPMTPEPMELGQP